MTEDFFTLYYVCKHLFTYMFSKAPWGIVLKHISTQILRFNATSIIGPFPIITSKNFRLFLIFFLKSPRTPDIRLNDHGPLHSVLVYIPHVQAPEIKPQSVNKTFSQRLLTLDVTSDQTALCSHPHGPCVTCSPVLAVVTAWNSEPPLLWGQQNVNKSLGPAWTATH